MLTHKAYLLSTAFPTISPIAWTGFTNATWPCFLDGFWRHNFNLSNFKESHRVQTVQRPVFECVEIIDVNRQTAYFLLLLMVPLTCLLFNNPAPPQKKKQPPINDTHLFECYWRELVGRLCYRYMPFVNHKFVTKK